MIVKKLNIEKIRSSLVKLQEVFDNYKDYLNQYDNKLTNYGDKYHKNSPKIFNIIVDNIATIEHNLNQITKELDKLDQSINDLD